MRQDLILQPVHNTSTDILRCFALGKPISSDQRNFLEWHQKQLSSPLFDPVYKYYIESYKKELSHSFLLPSDFINAQSFQQFKKRLQLFLQQKMTNIPLRMTEKQFAQFKKVGMKELIFWHGNQLLSGAPFFPGGIPPVLFFQMGNSFGVVKYVILPEERALRANILIVFEDMHERNLNQCVEAYQKRMQLDLKHQHKILHQHKIEPVEHFIIRTPRLSLDPLKSSHPY